MDRSAVREARWARLSEAAARAEPAELRGERFVRSHELFEGSSDQQGLLRDWLRDYLVARHGDEAGLDVLSVGCGHGIFDLPLIRALNQLPARLRYVALDPNRVACERFRHALEALDLPGAEWEVHDRPIEAFPPGGTFDVVHVIHTLYYVEDPRRTLLELLQRLTPEGDLVVAHAPKEDLNRLSACFWAGPEGQPIWWSDALEQQLRRWRVPFERERVEAWVAAPDRQADPERWNLLLDFITQSSSDSFDASLRDQCSEYLETIARRDGQGWLVPHPVDVFTIRRPSEHRLATLTRSLEPRPDDD